MRLPRFVTLPLIMLIFGVGLSTAQATSFKLISFDPPGSTETHVFVINDEGVAAGYYLDSNKTAVAYVRFPNGKFVPISLSGYPTFAEGLNNLGTVAGYYFPPSGESSFLIENGKIVPYSFNPSYATQLQTVNDIGDLGGEYFGSIVTGFLDFRTSHQKISVEVGAATTYILGMNALGVVTGAYSDSSPGNFYAFLRQRNGTIIYLNQPGWIQSSAYNINNLGVIVGSTEDSKGTFHGFYGSLKHFQTFDYPDATFTVLTGVNDKGAMTGRYIDQDGFSHGFIALPCDDSR